MTTPSLLVDALLALGRTDEALALTKVIERRIAPEDVDGQVGSRRVQAKLLVRRGELEQAERLAREASAMAAPTDFVDLRAKAAADLAEVLHMARKTDESQLALAEAIRLYEQKGNVAAAERTRSRLAEPQLRPS